MSVPIRKTYFWKMTAKFNDILNKNGNSFEGFKIVSIFMVASFFRLYQTMNILTILNPSKLLSFLFKMSLNFSVTFQKFISDYRWSFNKFSTNYHVSRLVDFCLKETNNNRFIAWNSSRVCDRVNTQYLEGIDFGFLFFQPIRRRGV